MLFLNVRKVSNIFLNHNKELKVKLKIPERGKDNLVNPRNGRLVKWRRDELMGVNERAIIDNVQTPKMGCRCRMGEIG